MELLLDPYVNLWYLHYGDISIEKYFGVTHQWKSWYKIILMDWNDMGWLLKSTCKKQNLELNSVHLVFWLVVFVVFFCLFVFFCFCFLEGGVFSWLVGWFLWGFFVVFFNQRWSTAWTPNDNPLTNFGNLWVFLCVFLDSIFNTNTSKIVMNIHRGEIRTT